MLFVCRLGNVRPVMETDCIAHVSAVAPFGPAPLFSSEFPTAGGERRQWVISSEWLIISPRSEPLEPLTGNQRHAVDDGDHAGSSDCDK